MTNRASTVLNSKLNSELIRLLYKQAPAISISLYALLAVVIIFFWDWIQHDVLLTWGVVNLVLSTTLLWLYWRFNAYQYEHSERWWVNSYLYLTLLQDFSWGLIGPISFLVESDIYRLMTLFLLGGMAAGGIATRGIIFKIHAASITCLLSPILFRLLIESSDVAHGMFVLTMIFLLFMLMVGRTYSESIKKSILLWLDNEKLITQLRGSKEETDRVNRGLIQEIELRKMTEEELLRAKERAELASKAKNQFLANVSHELRTPLNGIIGFSAILQKTPLSVEQKSYISQIDRSANSLLRNVNDILDITAIEAGQLRLYEQPFSLREEVADVVTMMRTPAEHKGLQLKHRIAEDVPDKLQGDATRLKQIMTNVLSNAIKYTDAGYVALQARVAETDGKRLVLHFEIEDTGIGIDVSAQAKVFDNFARVESFEKKQVEGVGLGLAIVKNLLDKMGGGIWLHSTPGRGTIFSFDVPLTALDAEEGRDAAGMGGAGDAAEDLRRLNVLVVDDNQINRKVLTTFLNQHGISNDEAENGTEALSMIIGGDYHAVLLDIQMPDISGIEVARKVRQRVSPAPVLIAVTAHAFPEQRGEILNAGFSELLVKPVTEKEVLDVLAGVFDHRDGPEQEKVQDT